MPEGGGMKFVEKRYGRSRVLPVLSSVAASLIDRKESRLVRRRPNQAAVVRAERIIIANAVRDG